MAVTAESLARWASYAGSSPLYTHLASVIGGNEELLRVINRIEHDPPPNLLLAGVQYLLMREPEHPLAGFYPSLTQEPRTALAIDPLFTEFVRTHEEELVELGRTRHTQTNEVRRCTALLPAIWSGEQDRFHLVDVGASAGLNLALDHYHYRWDDSEWGPESAVTLRSDLHGLTPRRRPVEILSRIGLDLHPVDPSDRDDRDWLEALVWPEAEERRSRLRRALEIVAGLAIDLVAGDAVVTLPDVLSRLPVGEPVVVMNSFSFNQFSPEQRMRVEEIVAAERETRPVHRVWLEAIDVDGDAPDLRVDFGSGWQVIGKAHHHGDWLELYARP